MNPFDLALRAGALPAGVSLLAWWLLRSEGRRVRWAGLALALGYAAGHLASTGLPGGVPTQAWQWMLPLVPGIALLVAVEGGDGWRGRLARLAAGLALAWRLLPRESIGIRLGWALGAAVFLDLLALSAHRQGASAGRALLAAAGGSVGALMLSGSTLYGQLAGALAAAFAPLALLGASPRTAVAAGAGLAGLWMNGRAYADLPWDVLGLLAAAPFASWAAGSRLKGWGGFLLASLVSVAAVGLAAWHSPPLDY